MTLLQVFIVFCRKISVILGIVGLLLVANPVFAETLPDIDGATLFEVQCAGCHPQGGNIIRRRQTLKLKSLERDGYDTIAPLSDLVAVGIKNMPGFADKLNARQIETVSQFVLEEAQRDWPKG